MKKELFITIFIIFSNYNYAKDISKDCLYGKNNVNESTLRSINDLSQSTSQVISKLGQNKQVINFDTLKEKFKLRNPNKTIKAIESFQLYLKNILNLPEEVKIKKLNEYINSQFLFSDDKTIWGKADYWASPLETFEKMAGDCEDFAILKYVALLELGISPEKLRISYVKIHNKKSNAKDESHMILKYFPDQQGDPLILDSIVRDIYPSSKRPDLIHSYDFNSNNVFVDNKKTNYSLEKFRSWKDCLDKMKAEGISL